MTMSVDVAKLDTDLNMLILSGRALEGLEKYYAEDVVMQENLDPPTTGKDGNRRREAAFFESVARVRQITLHSAAANGHVSFSEWTLDVDLKDGSRRTLRQVAARRWRDGLVVHERFYYKT